MTQVHATFPHPDLDSALSYFASRYKAAKSVYGNAEAHYDLRCRAMAEACRVVFEVRTKLQNADDATRKHARDLLAVQVGDYDAHRMTQPLSDADVFGGLS